MILGSFVPREIYLLCFARFYVRFCTVNKVDQKVNALKNRESICKAGCMVFVAFKVFI